MLRRVLLALALLLALTLAAADARSSSSSSTTQQQTAAAAPAAAAAKQPLTQPQKPTQAPAAARVAKHAAASVKPAAVARPAAAVAATNATLAPRAAAANASRVLVGGIDWTGVKCPPLLAPAHGSLRLSEGVSPVLALFECALGWQLDGSRSAKCQRSGNWTHAPPRCVDLGLRVYAQRTGLASAGLLSIHDEAVVDGLKDAAQRTHGAVGFTLRVKGKHKAWMLRDDPSLTDLVPSAKHVTYLFARNGVLKRHVGFKATRDATMHAVEFASEAAVLKGLRVAAAAKQRVNNNIIGFSIARGTEFRASLVGWEGLPLQASKTRHTFVLRAEVEQRVQELGCYRAPADGKPLLPSRTLLAPEVSVRSARIACAALARDKNHRYFAVSERGCYSGSTPPHGQVERVDTVAKTRSSCALVPESAAKLNLTATGGAVVGAGAAKGFFHAFMLDSSLLIVPDLFNGGFEAQTLLTPLYPDADGNTRDDLPGKQSVVLGDAQPLRDWTVETAPRGEVGLATYGSAQLVNHTVPEGVHVLYVQNGGSISQLLLGLEEGARYTLRFRESLRRDQRASLSLSVRLGEHFVIYHNPLVSTPLWSKRQVDFTAPAKFINITFSVDASRETVQDEGVSFASPHSTLLLDQIRLSRKGFSSVKTGFVGSKAHGRVAVLNGTHPALVDAFRKMTQQQAKLGNGGVGFRMQDGVPATIGHNDLATIKPRKGSRIYLNNGTVIDEHTTGMHSGVLSVRHPWLLKAAARVAEKVANSVAFSVQQNVREGVEIIVLSPAALPLQRDDSYVTYFFQPHVDDLGCWRVPTGGRVLKTLHPSHGLPVTRSTCAEAAQRAEHEFFALQEGGQCVSGRADATDPTDFVYYAAGRSARCDTLCVNGQDNCGGKGAATVFRLTPFTRVSRNGRASALLPLATKAQRSAAQDIFDEPGQHYFTSVAEPDLQALANATSQPRRSLSNSTAPLSWSHALQYHFGGSLTYAVSKYVLQAPALTRDHPATPSAWSFEGSNDGLNWTTLDRQTHVAFYTGQRRSFTLRNAQHFHFHRLVVTDNGGLGAPGFGLQGLELYARTESVRFLRGLYRFESPAQVGWDSSFENSDLRVLGGVVNGTAANLHSVFNVTRNPVDVKVGKGALRISNLAGSRPSYLALDDQLSLPRGVPTGDASFGVAFWFYVDSERDDAWRFAKMPVRPQHFTILSWGAASGDANANVIRLASDYLSLSSSFGDGPDSALHTPVSGRAQGLLDAWHHFAVSYDSITGAHRVWLDGQLAASRIYRNPSFRVRAERFLLGVRHLPTDGNGHAQSDEFNGLLDDVAIFDGPLTTASVRAMSGGSFASYLPPTCQQAADEYGIESGVTWGRATEAAKERYLRNRCYTKSQSCQMLSDQHGLSPLSSGSAGYYAQRQYKRQRCATWPSILTKADTAASCPAGSQTTVQSVRTRHAALDLCVQAAGRCQAYQWGGRDGNAALGIKPYQLDMCATYLSDLRASGGTQISTRISKYLLHPDSKMACDSHALPTHTNVPSSIHARWICDSTPGCVAYVWTGPTGPHYRDYDDTPNRAILCAQTHKGKIYHFPGSGHEVGEKIGAYVTLAERFAPCSRVSQLATVANITSSLAARRECDRLDGRDGRSAKCVSYAWDKARGVVQLCSSVPQTAVQYADDTELGFATPPSCQYMSDAWHIRYAHSWGYAPFEVKSMFHAQGCTTTPASCQALSDAWQLSPNVSAKAAAKVPGIVRDLWLRQHCATEPTVTDSRFLIGASFDELQRQIDQVKQKIGALDERLTKGLSAATLLSKSEQTAVRVELQRAKEVLQQQLDGLESRQHAGLKPLLDESHAAAQAQPTREQRAVIHDILTGLLKASVRA